MRAAGIVAAALAGFLVGHATARAGSSNPYIALDVFARVVTQVQQSHVHPVDQSTLVYAALDGVTNALDAHSEFYDPVAWQQVREDDAGRYVGIGAETRVEACGLRVLDVLAGGPAVVGGLRAGDCITTVNGAAAPTDLTGAEGESVTLTVDRDGVALTFVLLRSRVLEPTAEGEWIAPGVALLRIRQFRERAAEDLADAVRRLEAERPIAGAILDLRDNPGGRLEEAAFTVDRFVASGTIVTSQGRGAGASETHSATASVEDWEWPVVVLVNDHTASAAEIVAGALRDLGRARIAGQTTFGKGSVQSVFGYEDGSALKLTIGRYVLPRGGTIADHVGLVPDVVVSPAHDPASSLRGALQIARGLAPAVRADLLAQLDALAGPPPLPPPRSGPRDARLRADPALAAALAALPPR